MKASDITIAGAGIVGLWQALTLARAGHRVRLFEQSAEPFAAAASRYAGAMLAPDTEAEQAPGIVRDLGREAIGKWRDAYPALVRMGTLVLAAARDRSELNRFAKATTAHERIGAEDLAALEPSLAGRFQGAIYFAHEAHMPAMHALAHLIGAAREAGADLQFGTNWTPGDSRNGIEIDCRGIAARNQLRDLRGVRGERLIVKTPEVRLSRPVRLLHPRHPLYVVPQGHDRYVIGATLIESEDDGPMTVRSALDLLGLVYALHPAFGEAEILDIGAGVRPAFPDNVPRVAVRERGRRILVNGAYRHGFLLAPALADAVAGFLESGSAGHPLLRIE